jgi:hypothetical protein
MYLLVRKLPLVNTGVFLHISLVLVELPPFFFIIPQDFPVIQQFLSLFLQACHCNTSMLVLASLVLTRLSTGC